MPEYRVKWEIDVTADDPFDAARRARENQTREGTTATVFEVAESGSDKPPVSIDLLDGTETPVEFNDWGPSRPVVHSATTLAALEALLADVEGIAGGRAAYGMPLEDPEHPFHTSVKEARAAVAAARGQKQPA